MTNLLEPDRPETGSARDARSRIATMLARHYSELAGMDDAPTAGFSICRFLQAHVNRVPLAGREREVCEGAAAILGQRFDPNRTWIPFRALTRAMGTIPGAKGGYMVGGESSDAVDALRPWSVSASAGVTTLSDLANNLVLPRVTTATGLTWIGENATAISETPPALGAASLNIKTGLAFVKFSVQLLKQADKLDAFLAAHLLKGAAEGLDRAVFAGAGGVEPLGLLQHTGIGTQAGAALAHAGVLAMRRQVIAAGGIEERLRWVGTQLVQETLGARERATGGGRFLWDTDGILGKPAYATKNAPASALVVGDFSQAVVGIFGPGIRIDIDPSQDFNSAGLVARVMLMCDVVFPQPAAFCVATTVS